MAGAPSAESSLSRLTSPPDKLPSKSPESAIGKFHQTSDGSPAEFKSGFARVNLNGLGSRHGQRRLSANLDEPTRAALLPCEPIEFIGKPVVPVVLQRALRKAEGLTEP
jgi:hypothetical protein